MSTFAPPLPPCALRTHLTEIQWLLLIIDQQLSRHGDNEGVAVARGLTVPRGHLVLDRLEGKGGELLDDGVLALGLGALECEHRGGALCVRGEARGG